MRKLTLTGAVLLIITATLLVYWPALRNGFVWDDTALVLRDPLIRSWRLIPEGFRHFLFLDATASNFYRPIQRLSFVFDYQVYGFEQPWGWHLTSILVHAGAAVALFFTIEKLIEMFAPASSFPGRSRRIAFAVAMLWAVHPLHTSAVTYVAGRADPLAALFGFTGLFLGLTSLGGSIRPWRWRLGAGICFFAAMLSKESGIIFLPLWLLILAWKSETRRALVPWAGGAILVIAAYSGLRFTSEKVPPPQPAPTPLAVRPILAARALVEYTGLLVAPVTLRMERDVSTHPLGNADATLQSARTREYETLAGVMLLFGLAWWARYCARRVPEAAFALAAFVLTYLPISNLFSLNATIAEHWLYVPSAFLLTAAFLTVHTLVTRPAPPHHTVTGVYLVALGQLWFALLGFRTFLRQPDWHDQRTFIQRTIEAGGDSPRMLMNLANVEFANGHQEKAADLYREALRRSPDQPIIWLGYASILLRAHDFEGARQALGHAETSPLLTADCLNLRASLESAESGHDPGDLLRQAVAAAPENWGIRKRYIEYLHGQPARQQEALRELRDFLQRHPFRAETWRMLATVLEEQHQPELAVEAWRQAASRDVRDKDAPTALSRLAAGH